MAGEELTTPRDFVASGWEFHKQLGQQWTTYTQNYLAQFEDIELVPMTFEVPVELQIDYSTFARPTSPTAPADTEVDVSLPVAPSLSDVTVPTISDEPTVPAALDSVTYVAPTAPNRPLPELPADTNPTLDAITIPTAPTITLPAEPTLYALDLPDDFSVTIPEFTATRPTRDFDVPVSTFAWTWEDYDASNIATIQSTLSDIRINGLMLPTDAEAAIADRARGREDALTAQAVGDYTDALATRGLRQPSGLLARGLARIRGESRMRTSGVNRDLAIAQAKEAIESIKFAVAQGISLEMALVQANTAENELKLRGAQAAQEVAIALFNARVALHNADVEAFRVEAQVFESRIRAVAAQVDVLRAQVDAQKAIGDINESLARIYDSRMRSLGVMVDVYRAQVEGARASAEINTQRIEQARLRLQGFQTQVDAWAKEQDGYRTSVEAALGNVRAYEVLGNVYGTRVEAWATRNKAYFDQGRFEIETQGQQLERYRAQLQGTQVDIQARLAVVDARLRRYATEGQVFASEAQVASYESAAQDRNMQARIEGARLRIGTAQENMRLTADYALKGVDAQIETVKAKAQIVSQLAASSQSGVNFGASYSGSLGWNFSKGASVNYSGEAPEFNSVPPNLNF